MVRNRFFFLFSFTDAISSLRTINFYIRVVLGVFRAHCSSQLLTANDVVMRRCSANGNLLWAPTLFKYGAWRDFLFCGDGWQGPSAAAFQWPASRPNKVRRGSRLATVIANARSRSYRAIIAQLQRLRGCFAADKIKEISPATSCFSRQKYWG